MVKITALTDEPTPVEADLVAIVDNVSGTAVTKKATLGAVLTAYNAKTATMTNKTLTSPILTTPALGTPASGVITSCTGTPTLTATNITGLVATTGLTATGTKDATTFLRGDDTWAVVDASPLTTKGDVYTFDTGNQRLAVGADGLVLKADSSTATGLAWGSGGGGATATHAYTNQSSTSYRGTASAGTGIDVGVAIATEASGAGEREIYIRKIDANNEGVFTVIHKNGTTVEVQIA